ncbi:adenosylcobinamide-phosphate synthase CbiB [Tumebacillus permanentifrigoris]|uniref:Cobalamin biosynthesis protein CobD n=1 Tax=Tumebacillus permanentifrigoris TaxID=378543 RepID=A0A316DAK8_9BACL|nr:adenosylcobinamide-phosphate synthase CbiB [Tumebacillus permanentifrigoris]PWK14818.1 adenosylcobinamide-phosphate synthase [Tumebacillus permanentifrigoris]
MSSGYSDPQLFASGITLIPLTVVLLAYLVDLLVGDPRWLPHPVVIIGTFISRLDRLVRRPADSKLVARLKGCLFPLLIVGGTYLVTFELLHLVALVSNWLAYALEVWLISTTIATKGLAQAGRGVYEALRAGDMPLARQRLSWIVGRDTDQLDAGEISRGGIETVAENIVDAVTSPLLYALLGGAPLAMAYRAVNTLDSMIGYKNEKYLHLGWASARLDDLANYVPARLTLPFLVVSSFILKYNGRNTWLMARRDASVHPSPNSGIAEAAVAGALNIQLGGHNTYGGVASFRAHMGDRIEATTAGHILQTIRLLYLSTALYLIALLAVKALL